MIAALDLIGVVLAALGLFGVSLTEAALVSLSPTRLRQLLAQGHPAAQIVARLTARPQDLLSGLVVMNNICVILAANLTTAATLARWGEGAVVWTNLGMLLILLVFGEVIPKTLSVHFAEGIALRTARMAEIGNLVLMPLILVLRVISSGILRVLLALRVLPGRLHAVPIAFSEEDIKQIITAGEQSGEVEASEREMIHGVIEFAETAAYQIMVPRTDLVALPDDAPMAETIDTFVASGHSRIPVYHENADYILGVLYIKDLLTSLHQAGAEVDIVALARPAYFVPESKKSDELLREMQRRRVHLAVVVDEYGGTAGIITIEDLLEEIVGDIIDEYDQEEQEVMLTPDGALVSGRASLDKIAETFDIPIPEDTEAETISGLLTERLGRIPEVGDTLEVNGVEFTVLDVAHNRVERLRAVHPPPEE
jgi:CBS domain containing-hemolysin-like protein